MGSLSASQLAVGEALRKADGGRGNPTPKTLFELEKKEGTSNRARRLGSTSDLLEKEEQQK